MHFVFLLVQTMMIVLFVVVLDTTRRKTALDVNTKPLRIMRSGFVCYKQFSEGEKLSLRVRLFRSAFFVLYRLYFENICISRAAVGKAACNDDFVVLF